MAFSNYLKLRNEEILWDAIANKKTFLDAFPTRAGLQTNRCCNLLRGTRTVPGDHGEPAAQDPDFHTMDLRLLHKVAEELFPTLQYYESDVFISPHLETELRLCSWYNVFMRPITQACSLSETLLEKVAGMTDFIRCDFTSQLRDLGEALHFDPRFNQAATALQSLARMREQMHPKPYFRLGTVLNSLNYAAFPDFFRWAHEELGVDDVEILGFNLDAGFFAGDHAPLHALNAMLKQTARLAVTQKYKLRTCVLQMQVPGVDSTRYRKISTNLRCLQKQSGYVPPRDLEKMSYIVRNPRNRQDYGHSGFVFSNDMKRRDFCTEAFTTPYITTNGNVEVCGNCNTMIVGNIKQLNFTEIWNNYIYHDVRRVMFEERIKAGWYPACNSCCRIGASYACNRADAAAGAYRVTDILEHGENRLAVAETQGVVNWPGDYDIADYCKRVEEIKYYPVVILKQNVVYLSDLDPLESSCIRKGFGTDKMDTFTPLLLSGTRYLKGLYTEAYCLLSYRAPAGTKTFKAVIGLYDAENPYRHINRDYPGNNGEVRLKVLVNGTQVFSSGCLTAVTPGQAIAIPLEPGDGITLVSELWDQARPGPAWGIWADAHFSS